MDLILLLDAPQHRQLDFIFRLLPSVGHHPFILDETGRNILSNIPSDDGCAAVRERLLLVSSIFFGLIFTIRGFI
jgi:hypothetical protein